MTSDEFENKVKDLVRSYFPDARYCNRSQLERSVSVESFGLAQEMDKGYEKIDVYSFHSQVELEDCDAAILHVLDDINDLRFFKQPKLVYWRAIGVDSKRKIETQTNTFHACARFTLGY